MCGIAGFIDFNKQSTHEQLAAMTDVLHFRGPDDSGYYLDDNPYARVGLGHRRLSILDLSASGHQPMSFEHWHIVYNGEVYNYADIRSELEDLGYRFVSDSDTEVVLKSFVQWGMESVQKFNGMFAFAVYNRKTSQLFLVRDRSGVKPLYWYYKNDLLLFASELKSFHEHPRFDKKIDLRAVGEFLHYKYIPEPRTIFEDCHKLKAGHFLKIDFTTKHTQELNYWNVLDAYNKPTLDISSHEAIEYLEKLMLSAFEYRMVADVPVGIFLSGGYDSSLVTAILQGNRTERLKTFTIGFHEEGFNEAPYARKVAEHLGTEHTEYYCTQQEAKEILPLLPDIFDEPYADSSAIPTILVSRLARQHVSVSLSADGGDELFAGYEKYERVLHYNQKYASHSKLARNSISRLMELINPQNLPVLGKQYNFATRYEKLKQILGSNNMLEVFKYTSQEFSIADIQSLLKASYEKNENNFDLYDSLHNDVEPLNKLLAIDYKTYMLDDILTKVDRATMSVSLEGREPLLDHRLIEYIATLPADFKLRNGQKKYLLKKITHRYIPNAIMDRPKKGFGVPITTWFRDELKDYLMRYLDHSLLQQQGIFNAEAVVSLRDKYLDGASENGQKLWSLLMFQLWYEKWM